MVIEFLNAVKACLSANYQIDIVPQCEAGKVLVMIAPQPDSEGNYARAYQSVFNQMDLEAQAYFIRLSVSNLQEFEKFRD